MLHSIQKVNVILKVNGQPTLLNNDFRAEAVVCTFCTVACVGHATVKYCVQICKL